MEVVFFIIAFILNLYLIAAMLIAAGTYYEKDNKIRESVIQSVNEVFKVIFYGLIFMAADVIILKDMAEHNDRITSNTIMNFLVLGVSVVELSSSGITLLFKRISREKHPKQKRISLKN